GPDLCPQSARMPPLSLGLAVVVEASGRCPSRVCEVHFCFSRAARTDPRAARSLSGSWRPGALVPWHHSRGSGNRHIHSAQRPAPSWASRVWGAGSSAGGRGTLGREWIIVKPRPNTPRVFTPADVPEAPYTCWVGGPEQEVLVMDSTLE